MCAEAHPGVVLAAPVEQLTHEAEVVDSVDALAVPSTSEQVPASAAPTDVAPARLDALDDRASADSEVSEFEAETRPEEASGARVLLPDAGDSPVDPTKLGALSEGGTNSGVLELSLGSIVGVISASLVANGIFQLLVGLERADICAQPGANNDPQCVSVDTPQLRYAASGLSFVFAIPTAVAAGLWIRRGVRVHRDYRAYRSNQAAKAPRTLRVSPYFGTRGRAGASLSLRF